MPVEEEPPNRDRSMKALLLAVLMLPGLLYAYSPEEMVTEIPGLAPKGEFPCRMTAESVEAKYCWEFTYDNARYRAVTDTPSVKDDVVLIFTPKSEAFPEGTVPLEYFQDIIDNGDIGQSI